jgi:hypothetical protein
VLCAVAYLPSFNNGFISDDYVILGRLDNLPGDFLYLFSVPPECFRLTSYLVFGTLRDLFGYRAEMFYVFNVLLHLANSILLWKWLTRATRSSATGFIAALLFACTQGHQEAVMWLAAMNETLLGCCVLLCLISWDQGRWFRASGFFLAGLFSKESALMLMGLLPLIEGRGGRPFRLHRGYALVLAIAAGFAALFYQLSARNFMLNTGSYALGLHAVVVFVNSMHRLMFPWTYLAIILCLLPRRSAESPGVPPASAKDTGSIEAVAAWSRLRPLRGLLFAAIALLPYIFLTYQNHVTSRQEYVASMGIAWSLALLVQRLDRMWLQRAFLVAFSLANIGYIWIKDRQFEQRAAPTNQLIAELKKLPPQNLAILDFPANPWIAKNIIRMVPGWQPDHIHLNPSPAECPSCLVLQWDPKRERYEERKSR